VDEKPTSKAVKNIHLKKVVNMNELKKLLAPYGELKSQPASYWTGEFDLPAPIAAFYAEIGPYGETIHQNVGPVGVGIDLGGNPVCLPPLHKLWDLQMGYRTHGITKERIKDWPDEWLVIAAEGANPYIFNIKDAQIYFDFAGSGKWQPKWLAPDIATAFGGLATLANARAELDEEADFDDFEMLPAAREKCLAKLATFLGDAEKAQAFVDTLEW
jgi:hypothetical protein